MSEHTEHDSATCPVCGEDYCPKCDQCLAQSSARVAELEATLDDFIAIAESWGVNNGDIPLTHKNVLHCLNEALADRANGGDDGLR